tara:strand:- start:524 stop:958 length:435 start_codon:yes stop_codon:yes gene_type:complete
MGCIELTLNKRLCMGQLVLATLYADDEAAGAAIAGLAIQALRPEVIVWAGAGAGMGAGSTSSLRIAPIVTPRVIKSSSKMSKNSAMAFGPPADFLSPQQKPSHAPPLKNFFEASGPFCSSANRGRTHTPRGYLAPSLGRRRSGS